MTPTIEGFMRQLIRGALARGFLRLDVLEAEHGALAMTLGFQGPRTYYLYNMAYDPDAASLSRASSCSRR